MPGSISNKVNYEFHPDGYIICTPQPGVEIELEDAVQLFEAARTRYGKPFGLLFNRIHEASISFSVYEYIESAADIVAMAVVLYDRGSFPAARMEARYFRGTPYASFFDLDTAQVWICEQLGDRAKPTDA